MQRLNLVKIQDCHVANKCSKTLILQTFKIYKIKQQQNNKIYSIYFFLVFLFVAHFNYFDLSIMTYPNIYLSDSNYFLSICHVIRQKLISIYCKIPELKIKSRKLQTQLYNLHAVHIQKYL